MKDYIPYLSDNEIFSTMDTDVCYLNCLNGKAVKLTM